MPWCSEGPEGRAPTSVTVGCGMWATEQAFGHVWWELLCWHSRQEEGTLWWFGRAVPVSWALVGLPEGCLPRERGLRQHLLLAASGTALGALPATKKPCPGGLQRGRPGEVQKLTRKQESRTITTHKRKIWQENMMRQERLLLCAWGEIVLWKEVSHSLTRHGRRAHLGRPSFSSEPRKFTFRPLADFSYCCFSEGHWLPCKLKKLSYYNFTFNWSFTFISRSSEKLFNCKSTNLFIGR